jgi:small-conductance mechanosensitive channel
MQAFDSVASPGRALLAGLLWLWQQQGQPAPQPVPPPPPGPGSIWHRIWFYLDYSFKLGKIEVSLASLVEGVLIIFLAILVSRWLRSFLERRTASHTRIDPGILYTVMRLLHYFLVSVGVLFALNTAFSLDLTSIAVVFTALSVGIGFGLQFIAGDLASGFILLFERPVRVGDYITITGPDNKLTEGRVQSINLRTTLVMTNDQIAAIVPNSKLVNQSLINWSYRERRSRISIPVGVAYDSDVDRVTDALMRAAEGVEFVLTDPRPRVQFMAFGASSLDFRLLVWTDRPRRHVQIKSDINYRIQRLFKESGIKIPYPQLELTVRQGALQVFPAGDGPGGDDASPDEEGRTEA